MDKNEIRLLAQEAREELYRLNDGEPVPIYLHWTAGWYGQAFCEHYHFCIDNNGDIDFDFESLADVLEHTWHRNTGAIGIALECCVNAEVLFDSAWDNYRAKLGPNPPTEKQIDALCELCAVLCEELDIPAESIKTHAEVAAEDGYGIDDDDPDCRWDLAVLREDDYWGYGGEEIRQRVSEIMEAGDV